MRISDWSSDVCSSDLPIVLRSVAGGDGLCVEALQSIVGCDLNAAAERLTEFLNRLGVSMHPQDHGIDRDEWESLVEAAFDGERGLNFIGTKEKLHQAARSLGIA